MPNLDLFDDAPIYRDIEAPRRLDAAPAPPTLAERLPAVPIGWRRRLREAGDLRVEVMVAALWTGTVVEVLATPEARAFLHRDGQIQDGVTPDGGRYRLAFLTAAEARNLARQVPLMAYGARGTGCLRLVQGATSSPAELGEWLDGIEAAEGGTLPCRIR
jgi:hypothetical protein